MSKEKKRIKSEKERKHKRESSKTRPKKKKNLVWGAVRECSEKKFQKETKQIIDVVKSKQNRKNDGTRGE